MSLLTIRNVEKTYHVGEVDVPVLKGVSFSIERGEMVALMGASGSGKSTLMNILGCLDRPSAGHYVFDGQEVGSLTANDRALVRTAKLGFVFQSFNLLPRTSALHNVLMPLDYSTAAPPHDEAVRRAEELLERVGLSDRIHHEPSQMSGGQQQRVAIARALVNQPALLLADEPTGNLDSKTSVEILEMFQQLNAAGITVLLVTHDAKVAGYAHRTIRVVDGLIVEDTAKRQGEAPAEPFGATLSPGSARRDPRPPDDSRLDNGGVAILAPPNKNRTKTLALPTRRQDEAPAELLDAALSPGSARRETRTPDAEASPSPPVDAWGLAGTLRPFRTAIGALRRNKMRSGLTTLGIIIGVAAVIATVEISQGSRTSLLKSMATMGANNIMIRSGAAASGGITFGSGSILTLTPQDAEEISREASAVAAVAPVVQIQGTQAIHGNRNWIPMSTLGTTPAYLAIRDWELLDEGEMFTDADVRNSTKVCVVGKTIVKELFDGQSPIGQELRLKNVTLRVIGVLSRKGANMMGMDQDDSLLAPWTTIKYRISDNSAANAAAKDAPAGSGATSGSVNTLKKLYPDAVSLFPQQSATQQANNPQQLRVTNVDQVMLKAASTEQIPQAIAQLTAILREKHRLREGQPNDFNIRDMTEMVNTMGSMSQMIGALLLIVAMISLAVGGVGIMNIMLVSVTERTREIGLRMAVGARSHHILRQFLIEAVVLCLLGGLAGIAAGRGLSLGVWYFLRWPIAASWPAIAAAFLVSAGIGVAFGFYPAWKASRLDPIEALRYE